MKTKEEKLKLLERLVKEGHITLCEAFDLSETEKEYIPYFTTQWQEPLQWEPYKWTNPGTITFGTGSGYIAGSSNTVLNTNKPTEK